jgi:hypothetical protein
MSKNQYKVSYTSSASYYPKAHRPAANRIAVFHQQRLDISDAQSFALDSENI